MIDDAKMKKLRRARCFISAQPWARSDHDLIASEMGKGGEPLCIAHFYRSGPVGPPEVASVAIQEANVELAAAAPELFDALDEAQAKLDEREAEVTALRAELQRRDAERTVLLDVRRARPPGTQIKLEARRGGVRRASCCTQP